MKRQTVNRLLASAALASLCCAGIDRAQAQVTIGSATSTSLTDVTTPIATATANNGAPDDVVTEGNVSFAIPSGVPSIVLNSNNYVNNAGSIYAYDFSNTAGILILGGYTGYLTSSGTITLTDSNISNVVPLTPGVDRFGIQVQGTAPFNGYIDLTEGSITIRGNNSAGIFIAPGITGDLTSGASISVVGNNSYGILATGPMGGNVIQTAIMEVLGTGTTGISLQSVGGQVLIQEQLQSTGYLSQTRPTTTAGFAALGPDDVLQGGPALVIQGSVGGGVVIDTAGIVQSYGTAPAILLGPTAGTAAEIGVGDVAPDNFGLLVRGSVQANGIYDSFNVTGVQIGGTGGTITVDGGIRVTGGVQVNAFAANATAIQISPGASVSALVNNGTISAEVQGGGTTTTGAVGGNAVAVSDTAGTLKFIQNTGIIATLVAPGFTAQAVTGAQTALDLRANTTGVTVLQSPSGTTTAPSITGDVLFGSGNSNLILQAGTLTGNVAFGTGANSFIVNGGQMTGGLTTASGNLNLNVVSGLLTVTNPTTIGLTNFQIGSSGEIDFSIDPAHGLATQFVASGTDNLSVGAKIGVDFTTKLTQPTTYTLVQSGGSLTSVQPQIGNLPYFYTGALNSSPAGAITLNVAPRTASQAGVTVGAAAYNAIFGAFDRDANFYSSFNSALTQQNFAKLYEQMLPDYSGGLFEALSDATDMLSQTEAQRALVLGSNRDGYWAQQIGFGATQNRDESPGYRAGGVGMAFGWEATENSAGTFGVMASYLLANVDDRDAGPYNHVNGTVYVLGGYWRDSIAGFRTDASLDVGYVGFSSEREFDGTDPTGAAFSRDANANWGGALAHGHVGISDEEKVFGDFFVRPEASASYFALYQEGSTEHNGGSAFDLSVASGTGKQGSAKVGLTVGAHIDDPFFSWTPEVSVAYREVVGGPGDTVAQFSSGGSSFNLAPEPVSGHGLDASVGLHGGNRFSDVGFEADGESRGDYHSFGGAFVARFHL